ncbi:MAG: glycosyltransferase [Proteobacteria bacterium]|nr:glycosyltransferase [Pseudomonadota bacterium]
MLVYGRLRLGGAETLLLRIANHAVSEGLDVVVCAHPGELRSMFSESVRFIEHDDVYDLVQSVPAYLSGLEVAPTTVLFWVFDPHQMLPVSLVRRAVRSRTKADSKVICGIYHPRECFRERDHPLIHRVCKLVFQVTPAEQWLFMNQACRASHEAEWKSSLSEYKVVPITVPHTAPITWAPAENASPLRVVSVGRLVPFKAYNEGAIHITRRLVAQGLDVQWVLFGDGPEMERLRATAEELGVTGSVQFAGALGYELLFDTLVRFDIFVGMGTALLEAASAKMPSIMAVDQQPRLTYGYLHEAPEDSVGEVVGPAPERDIGELLRTYAAMTPEERRRIGEACHGAVVTRSEAVLDTRELFRDVPNWSWRLEWRLLVLAKLWRMYQTSGVLKRVGRAIADRTSAQRAH